MIEAPYHWLQRIEHGLKESRQIPLFGHPPAFPWETFNETLVDLLELNSLKISPSKMEWSTDPLEGFGEDLVILSVELAPVHGTAFWVIGREDLAKLTSIALSSKMAQKGFSDKSYQEGFYRYLALKACIALDGLQAFGDLSPKIGAAAQLPKEGFCADISLSFDKQKIWGRLICSAAFQNSFKQHFALKPSLLLMSERTKNIEVSLSLEAGQVALKAEQWDDVEAGDFVLLDRCLIDPDTNKGSLNLSFSGIPLFRARIKDEELKILDYTTYHEGTAMKEEEFEEEFTPSEETGGEVEELLSTKEIPLTITVEVARWRMPLNELIDLKPGNVLELPVRPEEGVYLCVNGKRIARGELLKLGDAIGVKVLEKG